MKIKLLSLVSTAILLGTSLASPVYATYFTMESEPNNGFEEAMTVENNNDYDYSGLVSREDQDFYKITVIKRGLLTVYSELLADDSYVTSSVYNESGELLSVGEVATSRDFSNELVVDPGTYYITFNADPSLSGEQEYSFRAESFDSRLDRISGVDRYETAINIAYWGFDLPRNIILATGQDFPDALAAGPLSVQLRAPILLTRNNQIPESVKELISYSKVKNVTIIGGTDVITQDIENYLKNVMGLNVERIAGSNRFETATKIADRLVNVYGQKVAYVVNGRNYPDALSITPVAAKEGAPILLTESDSIPQSTLNKVSNYDEFFVIGGTNAVSENIVNKLGTVTRISGNNRYETSAKVAEYYNHLFGQSYSGNITTGTNFADALAGAPFAALHGGPLLLTPSNYLHEDAKNYFEKYDTIWFSIFGGNNAVSEDVENEIRSLIE